VAFELLADRRPSDSASFTQLSGQIVSEEPSWPDLSPVFPARDQDVLRSFLAKKPADRPVVRDVFVPLRDAESGIGA
jgi:hypothetical protein